jgi:hypothetical protein
MTTLRWEELCWMVVDHEAKNLTYLGEAGNTSYHPKAWVSAMRIGEEVITQAPYHSDPTRRSVTLPSSTIVEGFATAINGKSLKEIMLEGVHYMYNLQTIIL